MEKIKSISIRFLKGMAAGAASAIVGISFKVPAVWSDFLPILNMLAIAATFGALTGLLLAFEKWATWKE